MESSYKARYKICDSQHNENTCVNCIHLILFQLQGCILIVFGEYNIRTY